MNRRAVPTVGRWAPGATGEERVGTILDALGPHDWRPIHEVDTGHGNIDHVLVGPAGVLWELLHLDGRSVRQLPLVERQPVLSELLPARGSAWCLARAARGAASTGSWKYLPSMSSRA